MYIHTVIYVQIRIYLQMESNYTAGIGKLVIKIYASLLLLFGIPGNIISAIIMGGDSTNRLTTRLIIIILAIADNFVLLTAVLRYWLMEIYGWDLRTSGPYVCKIHIFAVGFSTDFAVGVLCAIAVERLLVVTLPHRATDLVTVRSVIVGMTCFAVSIIVKNSLHFWMIGENKSPQPFVNKDNTTTTNQFLNETDTQNSLRNDSFKCAFVSDYEALFKIFMKFDFISFAVLPYLILFSCNVIIYLKLRKQRRVMRCHANTVSSANYNNNIIENNNSKIPNQSTEQHKLNRISFVHTNSTHQSDVKDVRPKRSIRRPEGVIKMLTVLTVIHVICTLPGTIFTFLSSYFNYFDDMPKYKHDQIKFRLVMLIFTNNAINFFGYCISCTTFRQTVYRTLCRLFRWTNICKKIREENGTNTRNNIKQKTTVDEGINTYDAEKRQREYLKCNNFVENEASFN
ncbi:unnamed protein product [Trichobilharzia szidati]|nr:unnamed protein product [Trichobilharzia szidati]